MPRVNVPDKVIVHHTAATAPIPQFNAISEWHKARDFYQSRRGNFVGYHYVIEKDGTVVQAKDEDEEGCHTIGQNITSIGVCLVGNFDLETPTAEQVASLGKLLSDVCNRYKINAKDIYPHRAFKDTHCFGATLNDNYAKVVFLRYEIARLTAEVEAMKALENS